MKKKLFAALLVVSMFAVLLLASYSGLAQGKEHIVLSVFTICCTLPFVALYVRLTRSAVKNRTVKVRKTAGSAAYSRSIAQ